jgi:hypothetical protein
MEHVDDEREPSPLVSSLKADAQVVDTEQNHDSKNKSQHKGKG